MASAHGYGTYLTNDFKTAKVYAMKHFRNRNYQSNGPSTGQLNNLTQVTNNSYCIAIVEVVNHPSIKMVNVGGGYRQVSGTHANNIDNDSNEIKYFVVDRDEFLQLRNLIVFQY